MGQSSPVTSASATDVAADVAAAASSTVKDIGATGAVIADQAGAVAQSAREALAEMRAIVDRFATVTGEKAGEAADAVKATGADTADRIAGLVGEARTAGRDGLESLADTVAERPIAALAVAAGVGLLIGLVTRPGAGR